MKPEKITAPWGDELAPDDLSAFLARARRTVLRLLYPIDGYVEGANTPAKKKFKGDADRLLEDITRIEVSLKSGRPAAPLTLVRLGIAAANLEAASKTLSGQGKGGRHKSGLFLHTMKALDAYYAEAGQNAPKPQWTQVLAKMDPSQVKGVGTKNYFFWKDRRGKWNKITDAAFRNNLTKWPREIESF